MSDQNQDQSDYNDLLDKRQSVYELERELVGESENDLEPRRRGMFRKGCAVFLVLVMLCFVALVAIGYLSYDSTVDYEEYSYDEYSPDLRMDLSPIFESEQEWHNGYDRLEVLISDLESNKETFGESREVFRNTLRLRENLYKLMDRLEIYSNLMSDTDVDNNAAADMVALYASKATEVNERLSFFDEKVTEIPLRKLKTWVDEPEFSPYKSDLEYWIEYYDYGFNEEHDALIAGSLRLSEVPEEIFDVFHYLTDIPEADWDYEDLLSDNAKKREQSHLALYDKLSIGSEILASAIEGEVLSNIYIAKMYGYDDPFEVSLEADGIERSEYEAFVSEAKKGLVLLHRWKQLEKELKGFESDERLHAYDYFLPWIDEVYELEGGIDFEYGSKFIKESLKPLGDEYSSIYLKTLEASVIDIRPRETKVDGAYTWGTYESTPYVLMNYYGDFEDMLTVGHELGHAVHQELARKSQSYSDYNASILISEMAATTNEAIILDRILKSPELFSSESREAVLLRYATSIEDTIFDQLLASEFQMRIHEDAKNGINLDADHLNNIYSELTQEYYGPAYEVSEADGFGWMNMPHFFYWGFYVQNYAIGYTAGISNATRIVNEPGFKDEYLSILKQGGSEFAGDQLDSFGYGKSGEFAVESMLERFDMVLDEINLTLDERR